MKYIVVLYHSNCPDGFGAAWAAWKKFKKNATYVPMDYHMPLPKGLAEKEIYLLDFSCKPNITKTLIKENKQVMLIDHHVSAKESASLIKEKVFAMNRSGAALTWKYFHQKEKIPKLLLYVEDYDLWKLKKPFTKEINLMLLLEGYNFKKWSAFAKKLEKRETRKEIIKIGKALRYYQKRLVKQIAEKAEIVSFKNYRVKAAYSPILASEIGNELVNQAPPIGIIWFKNKNRIKVSLRSNGEIDVAKIAEDFGGGGHKSAASFMLKNTKKLPWKTIKS